MLYQTDNCKSKIVPSASDVLSDGPNRQLIDNFGRSINYIRLSITDRCNLRCRYCRPEKGVPFIPHDEILTFEELERLVKIFCRMGINKVRVTGGEPFSRKGALYFLQRLKKVKGLQNLHITTNGVKTGRFLDELADLGISGINLSLDTVDSEKFLKITRRDYLESVLETLHGVLDRNIPLKINSVILDDTSDAEIAKLAEFARDYPVTLRFIERMPFSGTSRTKKITNGNVAIRLKSIFPSLEEVSTNNPATARIFTVESFCGKLGIIQGYSRLFCNSCNKVRITPTGTLKTCLYDNGVLDLTKMLRSGFSDQEIGNAIEKCIQNRFINGHEAERFIARQGVEPSMASIGG